MTTWNNGRVHDQLEPGSPQERLGTRLLSDCAKGSNVVRGLQVRV